jgi:hypothetical protein
MERIEASASIFDLRNFTENYSCFSRNNDERYNKFIEDICSYGYKLALNISGENDFYFSSTGDGFLLLFFSKNHFVKCFLWGLLFNDFAYNECKKFTTECDIKVSFGIGIESGNVEQIIISDEYQKFTYLGNVINIASRIESLTKVIAKTTLIIGEEINQLLVKALYDIDYKAERIKAKECNDENETSTIVNSLNRINQEMLINYISEVSLKGVEKPLFIFRFSPHFFRMDHEVFKRLINKLSGLIKIKLIKFSISNL